MSKVTLWTTQDARALKEIEIKGSYRAKVGNILEKYEDCSDIYLKVYKWFSKVAGEVVPKPEGAEFPVWAAFEKEFSFGLIEGQVRFELEVDSKDIIIFDSGKWDYILNYWYIPIDRADSAKYEEKLKSHGIKNKSLICMTNFYPVLKREVEDSWKRLFDPNIKISGIDQATLWEIRAEWIRNIAYPG
ncbi:MAG: DUF3841 domain-containing protein [Clostridiaceae bacterium]